MSVTGVKGDCDDPVNIREDERLLGEWQSQIIGDPVQDQSIFEVKPYHYVPTDWTATEVNEKFDDACEKYDAERAALIEKALAHMAKEVSKRMDESVRRCPYGDGDWRDRWRACTVKQYKHYVTGKVYDFMQGMASEDWDELEEALAKDIEDMLQQVEEVQGEEQADGRECTTLPLRRW